MHPEQVFSAYDKSNQGLTNPYRFCPHCGATLKNGQRAGQVRGFCQACNWVHYRNPLPGVAVVVTNGDQVLLGKRAPGSFAADTWCLPGGFIEFEENYLAAGMREVAEETGLQVHIEAILSVVSNFLAPNLHTLVVVLLAKIVGGTAQADDDICELAWFPMSQPLPEMAFAADRHIVERYWHTKLGGLAVDPRFKDHNHENTST